MKKITQTASGKAFEYELGVQLSKYLEKPFLESCEKEVAKKSYFLHSEKDRIKIMKAADEAVVAF